MRDRLLGVAALVLAVSGVWGCSGGAKPGAPEHAHGDGEHAPDPHAGHDHSAPGPHGGHLVGLTDEAYHVEWTHDDKGKITVYVLDKDGKEDVPIASESITIESEVPPGSDPTKYSLPAVGAGAAEGSDKKSAQFEIVEPKLATALQMAGSAGAKATVKVKVGDKEYSGEIKHEAH